MGALVQIAADSRSHQPIDTVSVYFEGGRRQSPVYRVQGASALHVIWKADVLRCPDQQRAAVSLQSDDNTRLEARMPGRRTRHCLGPVHDGGCGARGDGMRCQSDDGRLTAIPNRSLRCADCAGSLPQAMLTLDGNVLLELADTAAGRKTTDLDPIQLSIFGHRFMRYAVR